MKSKLKFPPFLILIQATLVFIVTFLILSDSNTAQMRASDMSIQESKLANTKTDKVNKLLDSLVEASRKLDSISRVTKAKAIMLKKQQYSIALQTAKIDTLTNIVRKH